MVVESVQESKIIRGEYLLFYLHDNVSERDLTTVIVSGIGTRSSQHDKCVLGSVCSLLASEGLAGRGFGFHQNSCLFVYLVMIFRQLYTAQMFE